MSRIGGRVVAEDVLREQELDVAAASRADGGGHEPGALADLDEELGRDDLDLDRVGPGVLEGLDLAVHPHRFVEGFSDRPQPAGPGAPSRHKARVPLDGDARLGGRSDEAGAPLAHDRVRPDGHCLVAEPHRLDRARGGDEGHREGHERVGRGAPDGRREVGLPRVETHLHGVDAGLLGGGRLLHGERQRLHEHPFPLLVAEVLHGVIAGPVGTPEGHDPLEAALGRISRRDASVAGRVARHGSHPLWCSTCFAPNGTKVAVPCSRARARAEPLRARRPRRPRRRCPWRRWIRRSRARR